MQKGEVTVEEGEAVDASQTVSDDDDQSQSTVVPAMSNPATASQPVVEAEAATLEKSGWKKFCGCAHDVLDLLKRFSSESSYPRMRESVLFVVCLAPVILGVAVVWVLVVPKEAPDVVPRYGKQEAKARQVDWTKPQTQPAKTAPPPSSSSGRAVPFSGMWGLKMIWDQLTAAHGAVALPFMVLMMYYMLMIRGRGPQ